MMYSSIICAQCISYTYTAFSDTEAKNVKTSKKVSMLHL